MMILEDDDVDDDDDSINDIKKTRTNIHYEWTEREPKQHKLYIYFWNIGKKIFFIHIFISKATIVYLPHYEYLKKKIIHSICVVLFIGPLFVGQCVKPHLSEKYIIKELKKNIRKPAQTHTHTYTHSHLLAHSHMFSFVWMNCNHGYLNKK